MFYKARVVTIVDGQLAWRRGTGDYKGNDRSTYFVLADDGNPIMAFVAGSTVGRGGSERMVSLQGGVLVVRPALGRPDQNSFTEVVLEPGKAGWWETSGCKIYRQTEPESDAAADEASTRKGGRHGKVVATQPAVESVGPLPADAQQAVAAVLQGHQVWCGNGGAIVLRAPDGTFCAPDQFPVSIKGFLTGAHRQKVLQLLRSAPGTGRLEEVPLTRPPTRGYFLDGRHNGLEPGWHWREGSHRHFICDRRDGQRINTLNEVMHSGDAAANNSRGRWAGLAGVVDPQGSVYLQDRSGTDFELLVECPGGTVREFSVLVSTHGTGGLALVSFKLSHLERQWRFHSVRGGQLPYVVAFGNKGSAHVFRRPS